jgi:UDP-perosamine 4-acetyltransferase
MLNAGETIEGIIDGPERIGRKIFGVSYIGTDEDLPSMQQEGLEAIVSVGSVRDNKPRDLLFDTVKAAGFTVGVFTARSSLISRGVHLEEGTVALEGTIINAGAVAGANCVINTGAIIEHDVILGRSVFVGPGAVVSGNVTVENLAFIGAGAVVIQGIRIGTGSVVAAGSVVTKDVPDGVFVGGRPAKAIPGNK